MVILSLVLFLYLIRLWIKNEKVGLKNKLTPENLKERRERLLGVSIITFAHLAFSIKMWLLDFYSTTSSFIFKSPEMSAKEVLAFNTLVWIWVAFIILVMGYFIKTTRKQIYLVKKRNLE